MAPTFKRLWKPSLQLHTLRKKFLRLSQIEHSTQYLEGPNSTWVIWKDHLDPKIPIMVLPGTIWSFQVLNRVLYLWQHEAPKKVLWSTFFLGAWLHFGMQMQKHTLVFTTIASNALKVLQTVRMQWEIPPPHFLLFLLTFTIFFLCSEFILFYHHCFLFVWFFNPVPLMKC